MKMYENIKMSNVLEHLDDKTINELSVHWPSIRYTDESAKSALRRFDITTISELYKKALDINYASLAVLAAEAIIEYDEHNRRFLTARYGNPGKSLIKEVIVKELQSAFDRHRFSIGSTMMSNLGFTFLCKCHEYDYLLAKYGQELSRGLIFMGPEDWFKETLRNSHGVPSITQSIPWAKALIDS